MGHTIQGVDVGSTATHAQQRVRCQSPAVFKWPGTTVVTSSYPAKGVSSSPFPTARVVQRSAQTLLTSRGMSGTRCHVSQAPLVTPTVAYRCSKVAGEDFTKQSKAVVVSKAVESPHQVGAEAQLPRTVAIAGKTFVLEGILGKGSFGTVFAGRKQGTGQEPLEVAVKEISCRSTKERKQAEYEAELLRMLGLEDKQKVACPRFVAVDVTATGSDQCTLRVAMEKVAGEPLDDFAKKLGNKRSHCDAVTLAQELLKQMCPTLRQVSVLCLHRDINAHNIMLACSASKQDDTFTLIDFGLATDMSTWRDGAWAQSNVAGDCRYWPVSSWKQILFGYKYTSQDSESLSEYMFNLDVHSLALTCIQLLVEVTEGDVPAYFQGVYQAWRTYWQDATRFWKQLMSFVRGQGGDFKHFKSSLLQQQVVETYRRNLQNLREALTSCAAASTSGHASFLATLAQMLAGRRLEWVEISGMLVYAPEQVVVVPDWAAADCFTHRRVHTTDGTPALTKEVPEISIESRAGELPAVPVSTQGSRVQRKPGASRRAQSADTSYVIPAYPQRLVQHGAGLARVTSCLGKLSAIDFVRSADKQHILSQSTSKILLTSPRPMCC